MKIFIRFLLILTALLVIGAFAILYAIYNSDAGQQDVLDEATFTEEVEDMDITVENARVDILPSDDGTSRIVLNGNSDDVTLRTDMSGGRLTIEVEDRSRFFFFGFNRAYSLQVYVPANGLETLTVESDNGAIEAKDITADELSFQADNGRIELDTVDSDRVNVGTDNGRIELTNTDADITVRSSNGRIIFRDVSGEVQARANNGRIELITDTLDFPVDFETDNGRIEIRTQNEPPNARIESRVDNGRIDVFGQSSSLVTFGAGEVLIRLETDNGSIDVE